MQRIGGLQSGLDLWEIGIIPSLLSNSGTWAGLKTSHLKELDEIQEYFLKRLLSVPNSTPKPALLHDTETLKMKSRIHKNILNFVKHTSMLDTNDLAKEILDEQVSNNWSGLVKEAIQISEDLKVEGLLDEKVSKKRLKNVIRTSVRDRNEDEISEEIKRYKKMTILREEKTKKNNYIKKENIPHARVVFRHRCEMFDSKLNLKNNYKYKEENYLCDSCESKQDDNLHVLYCDSYKELRVGKDLNNNKDLGTYLLKVLNIRTKLKLTK